MKRWIGSMALAVVASTALAQAPFTIVRPADGSRVREKVRVLIPKDSVPTGGYVGVFIGGKFVEATVPAVNGRFREYILDTKARNIPDSEPGKPLKLELVLYVDFGGEPRIVDRSSVDVLVGNKASIPIPNEGLKLRYGFRPGKEMVYSMEQRVAVSSMTEAQNRSGGRPAELPLDSTRVRLLYAVDNAYANGDGLVRLQALPNRGKDYTVLQTSLDSQPTVYMTDDLAPIYMRLTNTGRQVFGSIPFYTPIPGSSASGSVETNLYAAFPLPALPANAVRPGDSWAGRFQRGALDLSNLYEQSSVVSNFPARGEFVGVEWEMGHPCAKIRNVIAVGTTSEEGRRLRQQGASFGESERVSVTETIWFALDTRQVVRVVRDTTVEGSVSATALGFASGQGGAGAPGGGAGPMGIGGPAGPGGPAGGGPRGGPRGTGGPGGRDDEDRWFFPGSFDFGRNLNFQGGPPPGFQIPGGVGSGPRGGMPPGVGPQGGRPGFPGQGGPGPAGIGGGGFQQAQNLFVRVRIQQIYVLEK